MRSAIWSDMLQRMRERLSDPILWFPFPALIGFGLVIILRGQLLSGFNHRLGTQADVVQLEAKPLQNSGIWLSVYQKGDRIVVVTDDHDRFEWPLGVQDVATMKPLLSYLQKRSREEAFKSTLSMETEADRVRAVLSVDQKLKYIHVRPILFALAKAKIANYGFETRIVHDTKEDVF